MSYIPDAPWIGKCRDDWREENSRYDEEYEDYLAGKEDDDYKIAKEEESDEDMDV